MPRYRYCLPPILLVGLSAALGLLLVEGTTAVVAPSSPRGMRITLRVVAAVVSAVVTAVGVHWLVIGPLRRILHLVYRMTDGDFSVRTEGHGIGMVAEVMHALDDLAGRLEARWETARASEARYRRLYENSPAGLFRTRPDGRVLECNMAAVRMLGYDNLVETKTRNARTFYANPEDRERLLALLARGDLITNLSVKLRRKDGRVLPVLLTVHRTERPEGACLEGQFIDATGLALGRDANVESEPAPSRR